MRTSGKLLNTVEREQEPAATLQAQLARHCAPGTRADADWPWIESVLCKPLTLWAAPADVPQPRGISPTVEQFAPALMAAMAPTRPAVSGAAIAPLPPLNRNVLVVAGVVMLHLAALWALQHGLLRRGVQVLVPVRVVSQLVEAPLPRVEPVLPKAVPAPPVQRQARPIEPASKPPGPRAEPVRAPQPAPQPLALPDNAALPSAPTGALTPPPPAPAPVAAQAAPAPVPVAAPPAAPKVQLPTGDASYLQNPAPVYPAMSKRLREQGKVVVRVLIAADGTSQRAELKTSSGFERLDRAALDYVMKCRYVPGTVGGVPQAMWYEAPVTFVLE